MPQKNDMNKEERGKLKNENLCIRPRLRNSRCLHNQKRKESKVQKSALTKISWRRLEFITMIG